MFSPKESKSLLNPPSTVELIEDTCFIPLAVWFFVAMQTAFDSGLTESEEVLSAVMTMYEHGEVFS